MTQDPPRLSHDPAGGALARALGDAQGDVLSPEAVARVQRGLAAAGVLGTPSGGGGSGSTGAPPKPLSGLLHASVPFRVGLVLAGLGAGIAGLSRMAAPAHSPQRSPASEQTTASVTPAPVEVPASSTSAGGDAPSPPPPAIETAIPARPPKAAPTASAPGRKSAPTPDREAVPAPREGALLLDARRALRTDPARALELIRAHEREFPDSQLGPERERLAAEARGRLGP
jgi:hypothetical protein